MAPRFSLRHLRQSILPTSQSFRLQTLLVFLFLNNISPVIGHALLFKRTVILQMANPETKPVT